MFIIIIISIPSSLSLSISSSSLIMDAQYGQFFLIEITLLKNLNPMVLMDINCMKFNFQTRLTIQTMASLYTTTTKKILILIIKSWWKTNFVSIFSIIILHSTSKSDFFGLKKTSSSSKRGQYSTNFQSWNIFNL